MPEQFPLLQIISIVVELITNLPGAPDAAFDRIGTYFFLAFFVPSFVIILTLVIYFLVYFLIAALVAMLLNATSALAGVPLYVKIPAGLLVAAGVFAAGRWLKNRTPAGDIIPVGKLDGGMGGRFGEKAASLGRLTAAGLHVPFGYALSGSLFARYMEMNGIEPPPPGLSGDKLEKNLVENSIKIKNGSFNFFDYIRLRYVYAMLILRWGLDGALIVRSSFIGEDIAGKLAPGQYKSYGARGSFRSFAGAVRDCWRSFYSRPAYEYRECMGTGHEPSLPLIAQGQLAADLLGTAAAADPARGFREKIVVDFAAPPEEDTYQVTEQGDAETVVADLALSYPEPPGDERLPFLPQLSAGLEKLSGVMDDPPVVEWAWTKGRLYYLQARPLAGLPDVKTCIAAGMVDVTPEPLCPMTISMITRVRTLDSFITDPVSEYIDLEPQEGIMREIGGRIYADFVALRKLASSMAVNYRELRSLLRFCARKADEIRKFNIKLDAFLAETAAFDAAGADAGELREKIYEINDMIQGPGTGCQASAAHLTQLFSAMYEKAARRAGIPAGLIHSLPVYSEDCAAARRMELMRILEAAAAREADLYGIEKIPVDGGEAAEALAGYINEFGYLGPGDEIDLSTPRIEENPEEFVKRIAEGGSAAAAADGTGAAVKATAGEVNVFSVWKLLRTSGGQNFIPWDVPLMSFLHGQFRMYAGIREDTRYRLLRGWRELRRLLLELGGRGQSGGALARRGDIFFLKENELDAAASGGVDRGIIEERKKRFAKEKKAPRRAVLHIDESGEIIPETPAEIGESTGRVYHGKAASSGVAAGRARWVSHPDDAQKVGEGEIAVVDVCSPWMSVLLGRAAGVAACSGGVVSHLALAAREYGKPMVVSAYGLADVNVDGMTLEIDSGAGTVRILEG